MREETDITLLLDESSSMHRLKDATVEGINGFILSQQKLDLPAVLTLATFSDAVQHNLRGRPRINYDPCKYIYSSKDLRRVQTLDSKSYTPCGGQTALLDAMGHLIKNTGDRLACTPEKDRPNKVIIVIMTDGEENASEHYTRDTVRHMVEHQQTKYSWEFLYLGANQDAFKVGPGLGVKVANCMTYEANRIGTQNAYDGTTNAVANYRRGLGANFVGK